MVGFAKHKFVMLRVGQREIKQMVR